ncbi:MAG: AraC family transcriptional regulator [Cyanosarcina radialis HA8281-LM2]|jgi:AraC-like DNA-binding protein|nr:AraC family transcriptional regulator [Cyanosarcina radialis HA8281-LM2]
MTLELTAQAEAELWQEREQQFPPVTSLGRVETIHTTPPSIGKGTARNSELYPGLELSIYNETMYDVKLQVLENPHSVQFMVNLSGVVESGGLRDRLCVDANYGYVGGNGIQEKHFIFTPQSQPSIGVSIEMEPEWLYRFFAEPSGDLPLELQPLVQSEDWQRRFSPKTTGAIRTVVQQIVNCPFVGTVKRMYLQSKVMELMTLQIARIGVEEPPIEHCFKPQTLERIQLAAEILRSHLEYPPSQLALAQQVGLSKRTLQKGFQAVFGITPFAYLTRQRMQVAKELLRSGDRTVAEVANVVGYANPGQFAGTFRRQFGISPLECVRGKLIEGNALLGRSGALLG